MALSFFIGALLAIQGVSYVSSCGLLEHTWDLIEEGEVEAFSLLLKQEVLAEGDTTHALGATVTGVSELAWPRPASGCGHSKLINANVALKKGSLSYGQLEDAIDSYAVVLAQAVDNLRLLGLCCQMPSPWPPMDNSCGDYGRIYEFESNWDIAGSAASEGVRCAARRLYLSHGSRANNLGAAAASAATEPALQIIGSVEHSLKGYLKEITKEESGPCNFKSQNKRFKKLAGALKSEIFKAADNAKHSLGKHCH